MAWFDILGGVAGGLNQGLEGLQQAQRQKQQDQEKAQRDFLAAVQSGLVDPLNVSADTMQGLSPQQMKALFVKEPSGKFMLRMEPGRMSELTRQRSAKDVFYGDTFGTLPAEQQLKVAAESGVNPDEAVLRMSPDARMTYQRLKRPPSIAEYQDRLSDIATDANRLLERRKDLGLSTRPADKELRAVIDAQLADLRKQSQTLSIALDQLYGLPAPSAMDNPFPITETPEESESDWLGTAGQLALGAASLYGGGKALQLGGRYLLPRLAPALAARMGIGTPAAASAASAAAATRRQNIRTAMNEPPPRRAGKGGAATTPPRPGRTGAATPPPAPGPFDGSRAARRAAAERDVAASMGTDVLRTPSRPAPRAVNLRPDAMPSTAATMPRAAQTNMTPPASPVAPGSAQVFGPQGSAFPSVTPQGQQVILDRIRSIAQMKDPDEAGAALDELQPLLQYFFNVSGKNPFRP